MSLHDERGIWVKVDGVMIPEDAVAAADAGVSAIGMIFAPSSRRVTRGQASAVRAAVPDGVLCFGVFDDSSQREVGAVAEEFALHGVQFPAPLVAGRFLPAGVLVLRTVRVREAEDLVDVARLACDAVHLDSFVDGALGGTGVLAPWDVIEANRPSVPFVLSGGLRPDNVADAVARLKPAGVDVSSGVEREPGVKDHDAMAAFVQAARGALS
jgi:phosphoribosylanthranilate isomerase